MTYHSYDVVKLLSKYITGNCETFIPVSTGEKNGKNRPIIARFIVKNKVALFSRTRCIFCEVKFKFTAVSSSLAICG